MADAVEVDLLQRHQDLEGGPLLLDGGEEGAGADAVIEVVVEVLPDGVGCLVRLEEPLERRYVPIADQIQVLPQLRECLDVLCQVRGPVRPLDVHLHHHLA